MNLDVAKTKNSRILSSRFQGLIFIVIATLFWGGSASIAKILMSSRYDTLIIAQTRTSISFILLAVFFLCKNSKVFKISLSDLPKFAILGVVGIAITNYAYYFTIKESSVSTAILIQYTAPVWILLYSIAIARSEKLNKWKVLSPLFALSGCFFVVTGASFTNISLKGWATITGPVSAFTYAFQILAKKHLLKKYSIWTVLIYAFGFAGFFWLIINPPGHILAKGYVLNDWAIFLLFAITSILIPHTAFAAGLRLLSASVASIISTLEPVFAIVIAFFILGEMLTFVQLIGAVFIIFGIILIQISNHFKN